MLNSHRREFILRRLSADNRVSVAELMEGLDVSNETVRRDLKDMETEGLLRRIHGGAIGISHIRDEPINKRAEKAAKEKAAIAQLAVGLISDHTSIFLDTGSTTEALAKQLGRFTDLKLYTNSLKVAQAAREHFGVSVFMTPGQMRKVELDLVGYDTVFYIQNFLFDTVFMGAAGVDVERGFMDFEEDEARIRQALVKSGRNKVMLADSSKFGKSANICTAKFEVIDRLVTDSKPADKFLKQFKSSEVKVLYG
jgi:DeoR family glycerol-3-phosphate regulon repressor